MRQIDRNGLGIAFVVDKNRKLLGVITDGDIRRVILAGKTLDLPIEEVMNRDPMVSYSDWSNETLKEQIRKKDFFNGYSAQATIKIPVVDRERKVESLMFVSRKEASGDQVCV